MITYGGSRPSPRCANIVSISFHVPETERRNEIRFKIDGVEQHGLRPGMLFFDVRTSAGPHIVEFISSPRTLFTTQKVARGT